ELLELVGDTFSEKADDRPGLHRPQCPAVGNIQGDNVLDAVEITLREDPAAFHRKRRVADTDRIDLPGDFRSLFGPFLEEAGFETYPIAVRPAPLRPVAGSGRNLSRSNLHEVQTQDRIRQNRPAVQDSTSSQPGIIIS